MRSYTHCSNNLAVGAVIEKMIAFCCLYTLAERDMWLITGNVTQNFKQEYLIVVKRLTS